MVLMATWEAQFTASNFSLLNGGRAGAIYLYIGTFIGFFLAICSMAEIASMAPTTGGQYRESPSVSVVLYSLLTFTFSQIGSLNLAHHEYRNSYPTLLGGSVSSAGKWVTPRLVTSVVPSSKAW